MDELGEDFVRGLEKVMQNKGWRAAPLSEAAGLGTSFIRDLRRSKAQSPKLSNAIKLANVLGLSVEQIIAAGGNESFVDHIAIAGLVGAGEQVDLFDAYDKGDGPKVSCPSGLSSHGIVAVQVRGDSMEPVYSDGDILFYSRPAHDAVPTEALGSKCVCEDGDGSAWVKMIKPGDSPSSFHLISLNPQSLNRFNVTLKWAAPVRLHWPKEFAQIHD